MINDDHASVTITSENRFSQLQYAFGNNTDQIISYNDYDGPFRVDAPVMLNIKAILKDRKPSRMVTLPVELLNDHNGLRKKTFLGEWENCDQMVKGSPIEESFSFDFSIDEERENNFGHSFLGYIKIDQDGLYEFQTSSDDGSRLYINGFPVVQNDGLHGREVASGDIPLEIGLHEIKLDYFERGGQQSLNVKWKGPGFDWRDIPSFKLFKTNEH